MLLFSCGWVMALMAFVAACTWQPSATSRSEDGKKVQNIPPFTAPIPTPEPSPSTQPEPIVELSLNEAVERAVGILFAGYQSSRAVAPERRAIVISQFVMDKAGSQNNTTLKINSLIEELIRAKYYEEFDPLPFTASNLGKEPLVVVGTLSEIPNEGETRVGKKSYLLSVGVADLKSRTIKSKGQVYVKGTDVDFTPTSFFGDIAVGAYCPYTTGYISTCQETKVGDAINRRYLERLAVEPIIMEAMQAYNSGQYERSLALYESLRGTKEGDQPRVHNGIYLAYWKLGQYDAMANAFGEIVDYGIRDSSFAVIFVFKPASIGFYEAGAPYHVWLEQIARRVAGSRSCLEVIGHTDAKGLAAYNDRLSLARAERIMSLLTAEAPELKNRMLANGVGSRENIIGTGTDDVRDALDRRVSFKLFSCKGSSS